MDVGGRRPTCALCLRRRSDAAARATNPPRNPPQNMRRKRIQRKCCCCCEGRRRRRGGAQRCQTHFSRGGSDPPWRRLPLHLSFPLPLRELRKSSSSSSSSSPPIPWHMRYSASSMEIAAVDAVEESVASEEWEGDGLGRPASRSGRRGLRSVATRRSALALLPPLPSSSSEEE